MSLSDDFEIFGVDEAKELQKSDILPAGEYPVTITRAEVRTKDDKKWLSLGCQIDAPHDMQGRFKTFTLYIKDGHPNPQVCNIHAKLRQSLDAALGLDRMTLTNIIGQSCVVKIKNSEKNGATYENVEKFLKAI
jgi:hypothetical protein